jgi:hypothetical protein
MFREHKRSARGIPGVRFGAIVSKARSDAPIYLPNAGQPGISSMPPSESHRRFTSGMV